MAHKRTLLSTTERQVLEALWELGPATVRQVHDALRARRRWAYTTVQTLLSRLEAKGYVEIDRSGFAHLFRPVVSREALLRQRLDELADELCQGAKTPLVLALVDAQGLEPKDFERLRALLARLDEAEGPKKRKTDGG
jgi:predicted transcriptional regulator